MKWAFGCDGKNYAFGHYDTDSLNEAINLARDSFEVIGGTWKYAVGDSLHKATVNYNWIPLVDDVGTDEEIWIREFVNKNPSELIYPLGDLHAYVAFQCTSLDKWVISRERTISGAMNAARTRLNKLPRGRWQGWTSISVEGCVERARNEGYNVPTNLMDVADLVGFDLIAPKRSCDCGAQVARTTHSSWCSTKND